jgi:hypothetical protein
MQVTFQKQRVLQVQMNFSLDRLQTEEGRRFGNVSYPPGCSGSAVRKVVCQMSSDEAAGVHDFSSGGLTGHVHLRSKLFDLVVKQQTLVEQSNPADVACELPNQSANLTRQLLLFQTGCAGSG